jgi:hypothetical protein
MGMMGMRAAENWGNIRDPISYLQASMMFAFAEDDERLKEITCLDTFNKMNRFFKTCEKSIFIIDQVNALPGVDFTMMNIAAWITVFQTKHKVVLSSSANYRKSK